MPGLIEFLKGLFSSGPPNYVSKGPTRESHTGGESDFLDPSTGIVINIPIEIASIIANEQVPEEDWRLFYEAERLYKQGNYELARDQFR